MNSQLLLLLALVVVVVGLVLAPKGEVLLGQGSFPIVGQPAPRFTLSGPAGPWRLEDKLGKPIILAFWTTWCGACKHDLVILSEFAQLYQGEVAVVGICPEHWSQVPEIVAQFGITIPILSDPGARVTQSYQLSAGLRFPFTVFVNPSGVVTGVWGYAIRDLEHLLELLARAAIPLPPPPGREGG
jgi:peroxiredoxin